MCLLWLRQPGATTGAWINPLPDETGYGRFNSVPRSLSAPGVFLVFQLTTTNSQLPTALPLRELEPRSRALLPVLLAFLATRIAGDESLALERLPQLRVKL